MKTFVGIVMLAAVFFLLETQLIPAITEVFHVRAHNAGLMR